MSDDRKAALVYRLAQANKMIRLGLMRRNEHGELVPTPAMDDMDDGPIVPDEVDFREARRRYGRERDN